MLQYRGRQAGRGSCAHQQTILGMQTNLGRSSAGQHPGVKILVRAQTVEYLRIVAFLVTSVPPAPAARKARKLVGIQHPGGNHDGAAGLFLQNSHHTAQFVKANVPPATVGPRPG